MNETIAVALITAIPASLTAAALLVTSLRTNRKIDVVTAKIDGVQNEVKTLNESTIGQLGAATETRRIEEKQAAGEPLTLQEKRHVGAANGGEP